jgi:hypothetical protein
MVATVVYGARGSGKTSFGRVYAEEVARAGVRFCAIDLKGDWYGLKSSADGKSAGIPTVVFGGEHADVPLEPDAGAFVGETVAKLGQSTVIDFELFSKGKRTRFLASFFEALYHHNREPLVLLADEAQSYAPQKPGPDEARTLGAVQDLVKLGRKHGLGIVLFTQRGAGLNKEVSELCDLLVAFRTPGPLDQDRVRDWLDANTTRAQRDQVMGQLAGLPTGSAVFASGHPDLRLFGVHAVRRPATFDSSATPKVGERRLEPKRLAQPDLDELRAKMAATIERAKADDPKALRARIAELERQLETELLPAEPVTIETPVLDERAIQGIHALNQTVADLQRAVSGLAGKVDEWSLRAAAAAKLPSLSVPPARAERRNAVYPAPEGATQGTEMPSGERKILLAIMQSGGRATKRKVALLAGYAISGGGFNNYLSSLRGKGWISGGGDLEATDSGRRALGSWEPLPSGRELVTYWVGQVGKAEGLILRALTNTRGALSKERLAEQAGYEASGGGFNNALSRLRTLELIEGRGDLRLAEELRT